ncbi:nuclear transport factor 2 family protein [Rhizohabitans arisaemae]|uniref:nuclear transport factor 2 family protein n=1 Tax=Rhizohabitans arisaemae TaxID=2720610 RepID=UPI0024B054B2|nr:nuclear transport factor 2 family protein [Rhizohabitans arisaemae]
MNLDRAQGFAEEWVAGWNSRDLDRIMRHYADDVVFRSPIAARLIAGSDGTIRGKEALRAYWAEGLRLNPQLRFQLLGVYVGVGSVVIHYRKQTGQSSCEVLVFGGDLVVSGWGTHGPEPD